MRGAAVAAGAGLMVIVGRDGTPVLQLLRVAAVAAVTAALWVALSESSSGWRAGMAFGAGLIATSVGTGIALPHLTKSGLHVMTVAGLLGLTGGLVLLGGGGWRLVRSTRPWRRVLAVPSLLATVFVVMSSLGQAVAATNVPRTSVGRTTPADLGMQYRDVEFRTSDGVTLSGWYIPSTTGAAVVLLHGAGSTRSGVLDHAEVLARQGYGVLLFDARGHGRSGGRAMDFGWHGDEDTSAAVSFLDSQPDVDAGRIAAVGMSMGGEEAIGAAAADDRIQAVVAEGATNRVADDTAWLSTEFGWRGRIQAGINWLTYATADRLTSADPPISLHDAVAAIAPRRVMLIAAGSVADEGHADRYIAESSPQTVELWIVPDTGHTGALDTRPGDWERRVAGFLADALRVASPGGQSRGSSRRSLARRGAVSGGTIVGSARPRSIRSTV